MSASFRKYILRRVLQIIPLIIGVISLDFFLIHLAPGDPVYAFIGDVAVSEDYLEMMRARFGLDKPLYVQWLTYMSKTLRGDLGYSLIKGKSVADAILELLPNTLLLMLSLQILSIILSLILGITSARKPFSITDHLCTFFSFIGRSVPSFWIGQINILIFALYLGLFPTSGMVSLRVELSGFAYILDVLHHMFLPLITLTLYSLASLSRLTRTSMLEVLREDYITMARSKGLNERVVVYKHAFKNALLPVITSIGGGFGGLLTGATLTEMVFSWPGLGRLTWHAIGQRDYPILLGMFLITSLMTILANLITDISYSYIDPRIRMR